MDQTSQEYFDKIKVLNSWFSQLVENRTLRNFGMHYYDSSLKVAKDPDTLSQQEIDFLRARLSYLKKVQLEEYDSILNPKAKPPVKETAKTHGTRK